MFFLVNLKLIEVVLEVQMALSLDFVIFTYKSLYDLSLVLLFQSYRT